MKFDCTECGKKFEVGPDPKVVTLKEKLVEAKKINERLATQLERVREQDSIRQPRRVEKRERVQSGAFYDTVVEEEINVEPEPEPGAE